MWLGPIYRPSPTPLAARPLAAAQLPEGDGPALNLVKNRDVVYYSPLWVEADVEIDGAGIYVGSGVASCTAAGGIYADADGLPGARVQVVIPPTALVASTASNPAATGLALTLTRGLWWRAVVATGGASSPQYRCLGGYSRWVRRGPSTSELGAAGYTQTATSALPATATPGASTPDVPHLYLVAA